MAPAPSGSKNSMRPEYGKVSSAGSTICTTWPCAPVADSCAMVACTSAIGLHRSDKTTTSASGEGENDGGRLARAVGSWTIASAIRSITLRLAVGRMMPGMPMRSPPSTSTSASANATTSARSSLVSHASGEANAMEGERSGQIHTVCAASHSCSRT